MSDGDDDDFQLPFSSGGKKSASATKKAPAPAAKKAGPKSKRKASTALEAEDDPHNDSSTRSQSPLVRNGGNDSEPENATPVKSKDPFQVKQNQNSGSMSISFFYQPRRSMVMRWVVILFLFLLFFFWGHLAFDLTLNFQDFKIF